MNNTRKNIKKVEQKYHASIKKRPKRNIKNYLEKLECNILRLYC